MASTSYRQTTARGTNISSSGECGLIFFDVPTDVASAFDQCSIQDEEQKLLARQVDEDAKLYGARPEPADVIKTNEVDDSSPKRGQKRSFSATDPETLGSMDKLQKQDSSGWNNTKDWYSSPNPLDAWLNQSAVPSGALLIGDFNQDTVLTTQANGTGEASEIDVFRRVHIALSTETDTPTRTSLEEKAQGLELDAQIYFRNIMDRYPSLPRYLAIRLAVANHERSRRLQRERDDKVRTRRVFRRVNLACRKYSSQLNDNRILP